MKPYLPLILTLILLCACNEKTSEINSNKENTTVNNQSKADTNVAITKNLSNSIESTHGHYIITWKTHPEKILVNQYFSIEFFIQEPMKPINYPIDLVVDAGMQAHNHGMHTKPIVKKLDKHHFFGEGMLFHMSGEWQITLEISRGVMKEKATIEVIL